MISSHIVVWFKIQSGYFFKDCGVEINDNAEVTDPMWLETFKVVIRGYIIAFESAAKKEKWKQLVETEKELTQLEPTDKTNSKLNLTLQSFLKPKHEYNSILPIR